ncbi:MAG: alpha/beta fold hydrolase, partial [Verrucomicrobiales bacterium]
MIFALHGNLGSAEDFVFLQPDVAVAVDLCPLSPLSLKQVAAELKRRAELCQCRHLLGYSMGGRIALQALADEPDFWTGAVIISAHPGLKTEQERAQRRKSDLAWAHLARTAPWSDFLAKWNAQSVLDGTPLPPHQAA